MSYWKAKTEAVGEQVKHAAEVLVAFVSREPADEPPERPRTFTILDEHGVEREVFAPPGRVTRWPW